MHPVSKPEKRAIPMVIPNPIAYATAYPAASLAPFALAGYIRAMSCP